ncbi:MAG: hypothetical protein ABEJ31_09380 [Haloarculaceae archaeon]
MSDPAAVVRNLDHGDLLRVADPDVGEVSVIVYRPQETDEIAPGIQQFVFTHESGQIIGMNRSLEVNEDDGWDACPLVVDEDGYHHALLVRPSGDVHLHTRREPGQPGDWEHRGVVRDLEPLEPIEED